MKTVIRSFFTLGAAGAGIMLIGSGCAPLRDDAAPGVAGETQLAVLASDDSGTYDIVIMDASGNSLTTVDANLSQPVGISYHPDGFFVINSYNGLTRVDMDGETSPFGDQPMGGYRTFVSDDGTTTVTDEYDTQQLDPEGNVIDSLNTDGQFCWMDAGAGLDAGAPAVLDVFGPTVAIWDVDGGQYESLATGVGNGGNILGYDDGGNYYVGSSYDQGLWSVSDQGEVSSLGSLSSLGLDAYGVKALEPASVSSVFALTDTNAGSTVVEIDQSGNLTEVVNAGGQVWLDMVAF